jgi:hypothetical protein
MGSTGTGTGATTQTTNPGGGFRQTITIELRGALANTSFDVYIDQQSVGTAASHRFVGTFTTNGSGDASFTGSIVVATAATRVDNEIVLAGGLFSAHQYIQQSFTLCNI